jgi:hypothetical protein
VKDICNQGDASGSREAKSRRVYEVTYWFGGLHRHCRLQHTKVDAGELDDVVMNDVGDGRSSVHRIKLMEIWHVTI